MSKKPKLKTSKKHRTKASDQNVAKSSFPTYPDEDEKEAEPKKLKKCYTVKELHKDVKYISNPHYLKEVPLPADEGKYSLGCVHYLNLVSSSISIDSLDTPKFDTPPRDHSSDEVSKIEKEIDGEGDEEFISMLELDAKSHLSPQIPSHLGQDIKKSISLERRSYIHGQLSNILGKDSDAVIQFQNYMSEH